MDGIWPCLWFGKGVCLGSMDEMVGGRRGWWDRDALSTGWAVCRYEMLCVLCSTSFCFALLACFPYLLSLMMGMTILQSFSILRFLCWQMLWNLTRRCINREHCLPGHDRLVWFGFVWCLPLVCATVFLAGSLGMLCEGRGIGASRAHGCLYRERTNNDWGRYEFRRMRRVRDSASCKRKGWRAGGCAREYKVPGDT